MTLISPDEFLIVIWSYPGDIELVPSLVRSIRQFHPGHTICIQFDGTSPSQYHQTLLDLGCDIHYMKQPKVIGNNNHFLFERWNDLFASYPHDLFIRLDADSEVHKPIIPLGADWFGQPYQTLLPQSFTAVIGCAMGIRRNIIKELISLDPEPLDYTYYNSNRELLSCDDLTLGHYLNKTLGIEPVQWKDIRLLGRFTRDLLPCFDWMITHPNLAKRCKRHWPIQVHVLTTSAKDIYSVAKQLGDIGYNGTIATKEHRDYFVNHGLYLFSDSFKSSVCGHYSNLVIGEDGTLMVNDSPIGHLIRDSLMDAWFSETSCELRKSLM